MGIIGQDPFDLLIYQQGQIGAPITAGAAAGSSTLDVPQRALVIGEPVPVVFCLRGGGTGGVLISPGAAEARFSNDTSNAVTARYRLVLGEGRMDGVQVRDVFQRSCRVGTFVQSYGARAGNWTPGNHIVQRAGFTKPEASYYCGTGGSYADMTVGSFTITTPDGSDQWRKQVHLFIRGGMYVDRLVDGVRGPSNNFVDLVRWMVRRTARIPAAMIDNTALTSAARFVDAMGFACDAEFKESANLEDFVAANARYFLLAKTRKQGKFGMRPLLPTAANVISTAAVSPAHVFDESSIVPGSFEISYIPLADRKPLCVLMLWRQQPNDDVGLIRTTEVRYVGTAPNGPYEQHDLSLFCTRELHAVRVGAYILARRRWVTHTLQIKLKPGVFNGVLARGDIVQVQLNRTTSVGAPARHSYYYEVDAVGRARNGEVSLALTHFPVDASRRSLVAIDVMAANAAGTLLPTGRSAVETCDINSPTDTTPPIDDSIPPVLWPGVDVVDNGTGSGGVPGGGTGGGGGGGATGTDGPGGTWGGGGNDIDGEDPDTEGPGTDPDPDVPPPPGEPPPPDPKDVQDPIDVTKPPSVPIGSPVPQPWIDELNKKYPPVMDTPWPTNWGDLGRQWTLVYRVTYSYARANYATGFYEMQAGSVNWTFTNIGQQLFVTSGYITDMAGRVSIWNPTITAGFLGTVLAPSGTLATWWPTGGNFTGWGAYPSPPTIALVSATRTV